MSYSSATRRLRCVFATKMRSKVEKQPQWQDEPAKGSHIRICLKKGEPSEMVGFLSVSLQKQPEKDINTYIHTYITIQIVYIYIYSYTI